MTQELNKKIEQSIKLIQSASKIATENGCPELEVCYSGGKDSDVILELVKMSGVPYRAIYKNTSIDPKGTILHAKENGCEIMPPQKRFIDLIAYHGYPSRMNRHCCQHLKEYKILDYAILGIRADESNKRKARYKEPEQCREYSKKSKVRQYFPILYWTSDDVLAFIKERGIQLHPLYYNEKGEVDVTRRLGCMACPLASYKNRIEEFKKYPNMVKLYVRGGGNSLIITKIARLRNYARMRINFFALMLFASEAKFGFKRNSEQHYLMTA